MNNFRISGACRLLCAFVASIVFVAFNTVRAAEPNSGFLANYSQLTLKKDSQGQDRRIWVKDNVDWKKYRQLTVDHVVFYPSPKPSDQLSLETLGEINAYLDSALAKTLSEAVPVTQDAGPGVLRVRSAITAVSVDKSLKPHQLIPVALVFTLAKRSSGKATYDVILMAEVEISDSVSGEVLATSVREAKGVEVKSDQPITLALLKPQLDRWVAAFKDAILERKK